MRAYYSLNQQRDFGVHTNLLVWQRTLSFIAISQINPRHSDEYLKITLSRRVLKCYTTILAVTAACRQNSYSQKILWLPISLVVNQKLLWDIFNSVFYIELLGPFPPLPNPCVGNAFQNIFMSKDVILKLLKQLRTDFSSSPSVLVSGVSSVYNGNLSNNSPASQDVVYDFFPL